MPETSIKRRGLEKQYTSKLIPKIDIEKRKKISGEISKIS